MLQRSRVLAVATLMTVLFMFLGLGTWLFVIQIVNRADYQERARSYHFRGVDVQVPRGTIYDIKGEVLAASIPAVDLWAWTQDVDKPWTKHKDERDETAALIASFFDMEFETVRRKLDRPGSQCLKRKVTDPDTILELYRLKREGMLRGINFEKSYCRCYPHGDLVGHTLGFVNHEGDGVFGVEAVHDSFLKGRPGRRVFRKDGVQNEIFSPHEKCERGLPGGHLFLTIDAAIQYFAEAELTRIEHTRNPKWAAAVVLEPATGRILAAAGIPALDPSHPAEVPYEGCESHWLNRVFKAGYTPGSTFKPLVMAMALDRGVLGLDEPIDCEGGTWSARGRRVSDVHVDYRVLDPAGVLIKSSNIGMSKIALRMAPSEAGRGSPAFQPILDTLDLLGFGRCPGILARDQESEGMVTPLERWTSKYTLVSLSFGNEIAVTPLQMAAAFGALANDGKYVPPRLVERMTSADGSEIRQPLAPACRVFSSLTSRTVRDMLVRVVEEGSGKRAAIPGFKVAGKTGTAEKLPQRKEVTSSFVAFAPADNPALLVLVVVDEPKGAHYASIVAAPHVKAIMERALSHLGIRGGPGEG